MAFVSYDVSIQLIRELRPVYDLLRQHDPAEADQLRRAASSVARNLAEGAGRAGKDRKHFWRIAHASAYEVRGSLEVAAAWGVELAPPLATLDRLLGLLWGLTR